MPHNCRRNRALWIKFGTVNRKSVSYNLLLKLLMQWRTSFSHCHENQVTMQSWYPSQFLSWVALSSSSWTLGLTLTVHITETFCYHSRCCFQSIRLPATCLFSNRTAHQPIVHVPPLNIFARSYQNSSRLTSGHLTALTWTLLTTEFGAVFRTGCIRNAYMTLISWNSIWLRCGHTSVRPSLMRPSMNGGSDFWQSSERRDIILNIWCKLNVG